MYGYVYLTTNLVNGRKYVGQHKGSVFTENYKGSGMLLKQAFDKYGWDNFKVELLEECESSSDLNDAEIKWIRDLNAVYSSEYYNIAFGGNSRHGPISEAQKKRLSEVAKQRTGSKNPFYGKTHTPDKCARSGEQFRQLWKEGRLRSPLSKGIWITDGTNNRAVPQDSTIPEGWHRGVTHSKEWHASQKSRRVVKLPPTPEEIAQRLEEKHNNYSKTATRRNEGRIWMNDGTSNKFVKESDIDLYISQGYVIGRIVKFQEGLIWITNGSKNRKVRSGDEIPDGWYRGSTQRRKSV